MYYYSPPYIASLPSCRVLVRVSVTVTKQYNQIQLEEDSDWGKLGQGFMVGTWRETLKQKPWRSECCLLASSVCFLIELTTMGPEEDWALSHQLLNDPHVNLVGWFSQWGFLFSSEPNTFQVDRKANQERPQDFLLGHPEKARLLIAGILSCAVVLRQALLATLA